MAQPIIVSQGTTEQRNVFAEKIIKDIFGSEGNYINHIDFISYELEEEKKFISIEQARDLIKEINIMPRLSEKKIIWIKEAQSLSIEAQNALLKTLEEPPRYAQIILTVSHHDNLIPTVQSRCIVKDLNLSALVDTSSDEFIQVKSEFMNLLSQDIGQKIDWVTDNKNRIKDREDTIALLNNWEAVLREKMLEALNANDNPEIWKDKIKLLQKVKSYIRLNANASLAIEALLLNI